jgi:hypothetical protein
MASTTVTIPLERLGDYISRLGPLAHHGIRNGLLSAAQRARVMVVEATRTAPPANPSGIGKGGAVNTGAFLRAWKSEVVPNREAIHIFNQAPYAGVIEYGRRAGATPPPVEAIARWAQRRFRMPYDRARGLAFGIAKRIGRRGLKGRFILTSPQMQMQLADMFVEEIRAELAATWGANR